MGILHARCKSGKALFFTFLFSITPFCPKFEFKKERNSGCLCPVVIVFHFHFTRLIHFKIWDLASLVDGLLSAKNQWRFFSSYFTLSAPKYFFFFSVKDHLFMPHVRPVKLAGGWEVVKVQNYFNAFIKLSHPLTSFTIQQPLYISDLYSPLITLLAL